MLPAQISLIGLRDVSIGEELPEEGLTLRENAWQKAQYVYQKTGIPCFADDTGLEVHALGGRPGVFSARYAAKHYQDAALVGSASHNMALLLHEMKGVEQREARFRTVICFIDKDVSHYFEGVVDGHIALQERGESGFGYDPVFIPEGFTQSFAEMSLQKKNTISHRYKAFLQLVTYLSNLST